MREREGAGISLSLMTLGLNCKQGGERRRGKLKTMETVGEEETGGEVTEGPDGGRMEP